MRRVRQRTRATLLGGHMQLEHKRQQRECRWLRDGHMWWCGQGSDSDEQERPRCTELIRANTGCW